MKRAAAWILGAFGALAAGGCGGRPEVPEQKGGTVKPAESVSKKILIDGAEIHCLERGPNSGRAVLFLHGAAFSARTWEEAGTLRLCAERGYRAVAVDLPGHGESGQVSAEPQRFLADLLDALALERPVLVSPSMSGRYSLPFCARSPERLSGFVAVAPAGVGRVREELGGARVETLVVWGRDDRTFPVSGASELAALLPSAQVAVIEAAGHACYLDQPGRFHELLLGFLERVSKERAPPATGTSPAPR